ncbi:hypothetical protein FHS27_004037 [Rhodopirellula rubra]|uniref:Uncharacterized protein n=1 Tax=Aporhodopirellula rubra TaxID=980271 RepID=A0A7W5H7M9_9BACT|nr:hypothetical protein [Aporhodopirellula rubra]
MFVAWFSCGTTSHGVYPPAAPKRGDFQFLQGILETKRFDASQRRDAQPYTQSQENCSGRAGLSDAAWLFPFCGPFGHTRLDRSSR